jgi:predicted RNase H-like HicB family nuclease
MKHSVGLAVYESNVHAYILDLPGCVAGGRDLDEAAELLPVVIAEHVGWLASHGETMPSLDGWEIAETIEARNGRDFCFDAERRGLSREELDRLIARSVYASEDLREAVREVPDVVLDWEPPASAFASFDPWAPSVRTIRDLVRHVLQFEAYYRGGLRDGQAPGIFESVGDAPTECGRTVDVLHSLIDTELDRSYRPVRPGATVAEEWTVRKAFRRIISHQRAHTAEIVQRRTWLLLGTPTSAAG